MPKNQIVLPAHTDIAAAYGLMNIEARRDVRMECEELHGIGQTTFYRYLRTNRIPAMAKEAMKRAISNGLKANTNFKWEWK